MTIYTARDAARNFGALLEEADEQPVAVYRYGRPRAAIIGWRLYERYKRAYDASLEERQLRLLEISLEALAAGRLGRGEKALALAERLRLGQADRKDMQRAEQVTEAPKK
jgi:PHD/YefM family antitoxin component YafN of YafNO toxin-antitoxin module